MYDLGPHNSSSESFASSHSSPYMVSWWQKTDGTRFINGVARSEKPNLLRRAGGDTRAARKLSFGQPQRSKRSMKYRSESTIDTQLLIIIDLPQGCVMFVTHPFFEPLLT